MAEKMKKIWEVIRWARESRGFTQADIAPELGVSRATVAQMENGRRAVKAEDLVCLATFYGCSPSELLTPPTDDQRTGGVAELFRAFPDLAGDEDESSFALVYEMATSLTKIESMLGVESIRHVLPSYSVRSVDTPWQAARQGYRAAEDERRRLALGEGPVRFLDELVTTLGVRAARASLPTGVASISMYQPDAGYLVVVGKDLSLGHRRFNYAHGLAHFLFDREAPWRVCGSDSAHDLVEMRADAFASGLLLPEHGIRRYLETLGKETLGRAGPTVLSVFSEGAGKNVAGESRRVDGRQRRGRHPINLSDVVRVAHYYGTSQGLAAHRLRNLRLLTDGQLKKLEDMMRDNMHSRTGEAMGLPTTLHEMEPLYSRLVTLAADAYRRGLIDEHKFNKLASLARVREADREQLLAMTG